MLRHDVPREKLIKDAALDLVRWLRRGTIEKLEMSNPDCGLRVLVENVEEALSREKKSNGV